MIRSQKYILKNNIKSSKETTDYFNNSLRCLSFKNEGSQIFLRIKTNKVRNFPSVQLTCERF